VLGEMPGKICKRGLHVFVGVQCKECKRDHNREFMRTYYEENKEDINARVRIKRKANPEKAREKERNYREHNPIDKGLQSSYNKAYYKDNKDKIKADSRTYYAVNREQSARANRAWVISNRERVRHNQRSWKKAHPELRSMENSRRRTREAGNYGNGCTAVEWGAILKAHGNKCADCGVSGKKQKMTRDHVIPISQGGPDMPHNLQPLCQSCNSRKQHRIAPGTQYSLFIRQVAC
jgi:5-methylcytosine-specific restriction endonuclease McrA